MSPAVGMREPVSALSKDVLPEPFAPSMAQCCPRSTRQETWSRMMVPLRSMDRWLTASMGGAAVRFIGRKRCSEERPAQGRPKLSFWRIQRVGSDRLPDMSDTDMELPARLELFPVRFERQGLILHEGK